MWDVKPGDRVMVKKNFVAPKTAWTQPKVIRLSRETVYTVRDASICFAGELGMVPGIRLAEAVNEIQYVATSPSGASEWMEPWYVLAAFEKVVDNKGMETLASILKNPDQKIEGVDPNPRPQPNRKKEKIQ